MTKDFFENVLGLVTPPHRGIDTSREASEKLAPKWAGIKLDCLHEIEKSGDHGMTCEEMAYILRVAITSIRPAVATIANAGAVVDSGKRRKNAGDNNVIVWVSAAGRRE